MNLIDYIIIGIIIIFVIIAVYYTYKNKGNCGSCEGCQKSCSRPSLYEEYKKEHGLDKK